MADAGMQPETIRYRRPAGRSDDIVVMRGGFGPVPATPVREDAATLPSRAGVIGPLLSKWFAAFGFFCAWAIVGTIALGLGGYDQSGSGRGLTLEFLSLRVVPMVGALLMIAVTFAVVVVMLVGALFRPDAPPIPRRYAR